MTRKELREIGIYAIVTMALTVGIFSARTAISQDTNAPKPNKVNIQGLETWATTEPVEKPNTVLVKLFVRNPTNEVETLDIKLNLVRTDFAGLSLSRTPATSDNKRTVERTHSVKIKLKGGGSATYAFTFAIDARPPLSSNTSSNTSRLTTIDIAPTTANSVPIVNGSTLGVGAIPTYTIEYGEEAPEIADVLTSTGSAPAPSTPIITLASFSASAIWNKK